ncbi:PLP-dependent aminotransferase family protein [Flavobacterium sp. Fl-77]|uniref:PLP-dependent aminotransferase family protein n=1 Tax=Flavobacterium flavipigmentatum TaxID=2893884 RepID=A0AAJ2S8W9_9FLAO|nr:MULTISPECIES: PLP-dependent aminotransferase family protein [unclassified Flavobacterium]MDX6182430.1 PLP-dependent aminotransferase family protein [Flavobacterium sp. Fl-33]MDX6185657.1 PLP-dependent aminotransferase family protein [Flavobacterium sp. Fl-77]UFH38842.1 PLP-dependent aminotransferase family protein [Flavobacterium sp. F-70]
MLRPWKLEIVLNSSSEKAIYLQIADAIIDAIKSGKLISGNALPGSRQLASLLSVNRNTVIEAIDVLLAEGWLIAVERKGTFISEILPEKLNLKDDKQPINKEEEVSKPSLHFDDGLPDSRLAPMNELARAYRQIFNRKSRWQIMGYSNEFGDIEFRKAIVQMLNFKRGMNVTINEICITRGSQMAMYLASHSIFSSGDCVMIENPGYKPAWETFQNAGAKLLPVNVDKNGLIVDEVEAYLKKNAAIKAIYVTPHHQFPTTVTLSLKRRLQLIDLSNRYGFYIIEDDYDNEFHFGQRPILPLSSFETAHNYIYIGTLSKIVAPALRIGYLVSNVEIIQKVGKHRKMIDVQGDNIMEEAILQLINDGDIKRHLKRTSLIYKAKRDYFESICDHYLKDKATYNKPEGGLAFWIVPNNNVNTNVVAEKLLKQGIKIMLPQSFSFDEPIVGFRLGYASLTENQIKDGILALSRFL